MCGKVKMNLWWGDSNRTHDTCDQSSFLSGGCYQTLQPLPQSIKAVGWSFLRKRLGAGFCTMRFKTSSFGTTHKHLVFVPVCIQTGLYPTSMEVESIKSRGPVEDLNEFFAYWSAHNHMRYRHSIIAKSGGEEIDWWMYLGTKIEQFALSQNTGEFVCLYWLCVACNMFVVYFGCLSISFWQYIQVIRWYGYLEIGLSFLQWA